MLRRSFLLTFLLCTAFLFGCGGNDKPASGGGCEEASGDGCGGDGDSGGDSSKPASSSAKGKYTPDRGTATIKGSIKWSGKAPRRRPIDMGGEEYCLNCNPDGAKSESTIVGANGGLANVFVQIKYGLRGWKFETPDTEVLLDQIKCQYVPHMLGLRTGQKLRIRNSDPVMHNVHALRVGSSKDEFNIPQTQKGAEDVKSFRKPGIYVAKCEKHGWMTSYIGVCKHPFFAVTKDDGAFELKNVPPGEYTIEAWHEKFGEQTMKLTVADGATSTADFTFKK